MSASDFLTRHCKLQEQEHMSLVTQMLLPWKAGLPLTEIFAYPGLVDGIKPLIYGINGTIRVHSSMREENWGVLNYAMGYWKAVTEAVSEKVSLPDFALLGNPLDGPFFETRLPWVGSCQLRRQSRAVTWPYALEAAHFHNHAGPSRAGALDKRIGKAVFRGSPTGWFNGKRRAIMMAGQRHPKQVDAGLASMSGCGQCGDVDPAELEMFLKPKMLYEEQIDTYKYVIVADGNCISHRMKAMLSSDSAVFWVNSNQEEWYYPLLVPYKHFIPVQYEPVALPMELGLDLHTQVEWAEAHPDEVADIVREAQRFAKLHLSSEGQECFVVRFLKEYHELLLQIDQLGALIEKADLEYLNILGSAANISKTAPPAPTRGFLHRFRAHVRPYLNGFGDETPT